MAKEVKRKKVIENEEDDNKNSKLGLLLPILLAVFAIVIFIIIGFNQWVFRFNLEEDGYAIPNGTVLASLDSTQENSIPLVSFETGESVYSTKLNNNLLYIGDEKEDVNDGFPMFTRSGDVLYFISDKPTLIDEDWEKLETYKGLRLSDGQTYNGDNMIADYTKILLVEVDTGHQIAQAMDVYSNIGLKTIKMNTICNFTPSRIYCYEYEDGSISSYYIDLYDDTMISIGGQEYTYYDFLIKLGIYKKSSGVVQKEEVVGKADITTITKGAGVNNSTGSLERHGKVDKPNTKVRAEAEEPTSKRPPWAMVEIEATDPKDDYWAYNIGLDLFSHDEAGVCDGIKFYVYSVDENGKPLKQVLRVSASTSTDAETVREYIGQLQPDTEYFITGC